jgi:lipoyl(octanoyl) transferase
MVIDEAVALSCSENKSPPTLRFYTFNPPAISIGCNQKIDNFNINKISKKKFDFVRRITGGTAVLHKNDLVYSLVSPESSLPAKVIDAYNYLSDGLVFGLKNIGLTAVKKTAKTIKRQDACYLNANPYDVMVNDKKISGNAQARLKGVVLQHGTIIIEDNLKELIDCLNLDGRQKAKLLKESQKKVTCLENELGKINISKIEKAMIKGFKELFNKKKIFFEEKKLTDYEEKLIKKIYHQKLQSLS